MKAIPIILAAGVIAAGLGATKPAQAYWDNDDWRWRHHHHHYYDWQYRPYLYGSYSYGYVSPPPVVYVPPRVYYRSW